MNPTNNNLDIDELLLKLYQAQKQVLFQELMMQIFIEQTGLDEESVITVLKKMIRQGWLVCDAVKEKFFLRPNYVLSFPVVVSKKGLEHLRAKGLIE